MCGRRPSKTKSGALAFVLAELREAGADLQFIIARRAEPGKGVVFVAPLRGDREIAVAAQVGFNVAYTLHSVRIMGRDRPGIGAELTQTLPTGELTCAASLPPSNWHTISGLRGGGLGGRCEQGDRNSRKGLTSSVKLCSGHGPGRRPVRAPGRTRHFAARTAIPQQMIASAP